MILSLIVEIVFQTDLSNVPMVTESEAILINLTIMITQKISYY